jgi:shikimate kinase
VVVGPTKGLSDLWRERHPLYLKYADVVFDCGRLSAQQTVDALAACLEKKGLVVSPARHR